MTSTYRFQANRTMTPNRLFRRFSFGCSKSSMRRRVSQLANVCRTHYDQLIKLSRKLDLSRPLNTHLAHGKVSFPREKKLCNAPHLISNAMHRLEKTGSDEVKVEAQNEFKQIFPRIHFHKDLVFMLFAQKLLHCLPESTTLMV